MCRYVPLIHCTMQDVENSEFKKQLNGLALFYPGTKKMLTAKFAYKLCYERSFKQTATASCQ